MLVLKGILSETQELQGIRDCQNLWYQCPNKALPRHLDVIQTTAGPSTQIGSRHFWHREMVGGLLHITPSIDASRSPCGYHDFYDFELISQAEMDAWETVVKL